MYETGGGWQKFQIIYYGSPGTGKTWKAKQLASRRVEAWREAHHGVAEGDHRLVQFHPSFAYEDFIEGIRPTGTAGGQIPMKLVDGVFERILRRAARWEIEFYQKKATPLTITTTIGKSPNNRDPSFGNLLTTFPLMRKLWIIYHHTF